MGRGLGRGGERKKRKAGKEARKVRCGSEGDIK